MDLQRCDYGNHDVEPQVNVCHLCRRTICKIHRSHPGPGQWVACPDHEAQVDALNAEWRAARAAQGSSTR
jgi:hypothetical protein